MNSSNVVVHIIESSISSFGNSVVSEYYIPFDIVKKRWSWLKEGKNYWFGSDNSLGQIEDNRCNEVLGFLYSDEIRDLFNEKVVEGFILEYDGFRGDGDVDFLVKEVVSRIRLNYVKK